MQNLKPGNFKLSYSKGERGCEKNLEICGDALHTFMHASTLIEQLLGVSCWDLRDIFNMASILKALTNCPGVDFKKITFRWKLLFFPIKK